MKKHVQTYFFSEGLVYVTTDYSHYGYIDKTGKLVIPMIFKEAKSFNGGKAKVTTEDGEEVYIDKTGKIIK